MTIPRQYVPILKGKEGELAALKALWIDARQTILPLIEIPEIPFDFVNEQPAKSLDEHVASIPEKLLDAWGPGRRVLIDLPDATIAGEISEGSPHPISTLFAQLHERAIAAVPVTSLQRAGTTQDTIAKVISSQQRGVCLRAPIEDFDEERDISKELNDLLSAIGATPATTDLVIDFGDLGDIPAAQLRLLARSALNLVNDAGSYRTFALVATSFPQDLTDVDAQTIARLPRREWELWQGLCSRPERLSRLPSYGDYGISHPASASIDPRMMRMSASIRYTAPKEWLIVKGRNVRDHGFAQFNALCSALVELPEFSGESFSWGDDFIAKCARREAGPGNATTWRKVGTNHHLTLVASQLANLPEL